MHTNLRSAGMAVTLLLASFHLIAGNGPDVEKSKTYSKSYPVSANDRISVTNSFGEVKVSSWAKNEVKVDVTIIARSFTEERAVQILDRISIEDGRNAGGVYFTTNMKNDQNDRENKNYKDEKMEINYQVYMPISSALNLNNQFGPTVLPDLNGAIECTSKFGSLTTGRLANVKRITVEFGSATLESINSGDLVVKFSRAVVNRLGGSVNASFEHCSGVKLGVENSTRELTVKNNFTKLYLDISKNLSANFDINTHFGNFNNQTGFTINEESADQGCGPNFNHRYSGKAGTGTSGMRIKSEFGEIVLGHNLTMDLKADDKSKRKTTRI